MSKKKIIVKILQYVKEYRFLCLFSFLLAAVSVISGLYIPVLVGDAIDCIVLPGQVDFSRLYVFLIKIAITAGATAVLQWLMNMINNKITYHVVRNIRHDAFRKIQILPLKFLDVHKSGEIISRVISDTDQFADGLLMGVSQLFSGVFTILVTLIFMLYINVKITLVVVFLTPLSLFVANFVTKHTYQMFHVQSMIRARQTSFIDEMIGNQKVVKAYSREDKTLKDFDEINEQLYSSSLKAIFFSSLTNPSTRFVNNLVYAGVGLFGAIAALNGTLSVGGLSGFLSYANQYTKPFNEISGVVTELQNALACAGRVFELIEEEAQIPDKQDAKVMSNIKGNVEFRNVSFSYTPGKKLIEDFNLSVYPGQRIAIVGPTGCGKTTLINLIMRFYDVTAGSIMLDGVNIKDITRDSLRQSYGMVLQETWLKKGTISENLKMGVSNASDEEMYEAAKLSHAHSFIKRLPNGYNTVISEDGGNLSEGQKQLLCIARVMLKNPPMLILDEATSSIDTRTEIKVQDAFARLMQGRTSFIVAHRLSTIKNADKILVMKNGNIIEHGTHDELINKNGFYAKLYESQFDKQ